MAAAEGDPPVRPLRAEEPVMTSASLEGKRSLVPNWTRETAGDDAGANPRRSWSLRLAAGGAIALVAGISGLVFFGRMLSTSPAPEQGAAALSTIEPSGTLDSPPRSLRWKAVPGATSYIVAAEKEASGELVFSRACERAELVLEPAELAALRPGSYRWTVEARSGTGSVLARGEGWFRLLESP